jgi:hypothetical protein
MKVFHSSRGCSAVENVLYKSSYEADAIRKSAVIVAAYSSRRTRMGAQGWTDCRNPERIVGHSHQARIGNEKSASVRKSA